MTAKPQKDKEQVSVKPQEEEEQMLTNLQEDEELITPEHEENEGIITALLTNTDPPQIQEIDITEGGYMALVPTITQSTSDGMYKVIPRDYFITQNQKINKMSKESDGEYFLNL